MYYLATKNQLLARTAAQMYLENMIIGRIQPWRAYIHMHYGKQGKLYEHKEEWKCMWLVGGEEYV